MADEPNLSQYAADGPIAACFDFLRYLFELNTYIGAWLKMDENLRLCRAQEWLWNNRDAPDIAGRHEELAQQFVHGPYEDLRNEPVFLDFAAMELATVHDVWGDKYRMGLGAGSQPRVIGPGLELVVMMVTEADVVRISEPTLVDAVAFVVRLTDVGWKIAAWTDRAPTPGWPPQF